MKLYDWVIEQQQSLHSLASPRTRLPQAVLQGRRLLLDRLTPAAARSTGKAVAACALTECRRIINLQSMPLSPEPICSLMRLINGKENGRCQNLIMVELYQVTYRLCGHSLFVTAILTTAEAWMQACRMLTKMCVIISITSTFAAALRISSP